MNDVDVVVVGAIAGLGAAHDLAAAGASVLVLEREDHPGGRMHSVRWHDHWVDVGGEEITSADAFFHDVARRHGLEVITHLAGAGGYGVWRDSAVHNIELTDPISFLRFGAMSIGGRARLLRLLPTMARQAARQRGADIDQTHLAAAIDDASLEEWLGRLAPEFLEYVIEPLFDVFCGWTPDEMSRGWFVFTTLAYQRAEGFTLREGIGAITRALASELDVRTGSQVTDVDAARRVVRWTDASGDHEVEAGAVVVAVPGNLVNDMVSGLGDAHRQVFSQVRYVPHDQVFLWVSEVPEGTPRVAFFPRREDGRLASIGHGLPTDREAPVVRLGLKGTLQRELRDHSDKQLVELTIEAADPYVPGLREQVTDVLVHRWDAALPTFHAGHLRALARHRAIPPAPGIAFAGDWLANASTGAAHASGRRAARAALRDLQTRRSTTRTMA
ncbi:MAG TPA: FAD-dependent oxidoreductase [Nitriliruptorales bacterium]